MAHPLDGPRAKLRRGKQHCDLLEQRMGRFVSDQKSCAITLEPNLKKPEEIIVFGEAKRQPPVLSWGVAIGDIVHNLRSALDGVVWQLALKFNPPGPPPDPIPSSSPWKRLAFPIVAKNAKGEWGSACGLNLQLVKPLWTRLERLQPFYTGPHNPRGESLAILSELWNIDKHRHPALVVAHVNLDILYISQRRREPLSMQPAGYTFYQVSVASPGPLIGRTELGRIIVTDSSIPLDQLEMCVDHQLTFKVLFGQGSPGYGQDAIDVLRTTHRAASSAVESFASEF